jgi:glycine cleavage system H protein
MSNNPKDLKYTKDHEWAKKVGSAVSVGVTHHAQDALGAVVYVELPKLGSAVKSGASFGVIESTKAVSELFAPISGKIVQVNDAVVSNPGSVNDDPYAAWLVEIEPGNFAEFDGLLDEATYSRLLAEVK